MSTCVTSFHSTLGMSAHYEYARLQWRQTFVLTPMFYLMSLGLVWHDLHVLVIEPHSSTARAHTFPYMGTFWFHFSLGLSVTLRQQKDHDSIFHQGGGRGFHLCALLHQGWRFCRREVHARMWAYARTSDPRCVVWSRVRVKAVAPLWGGALKRIVLMWSLSLTTARWYQERRRQDTKLHEKA